MMPHLLLLRAASSWVIPATTTAARNLMVPKHKTFRRVRQIRIARRVRHAERVHANPFVPIRRVRVRRPNVP